MNRKEAIEKLKRWKLGVDDEKEYPEYLEGWFYKGDEIAFDMAIEALQERKTGKWISKLHSNWGKWGMYVAICSECGFSGGAGKWNFCPNCGARMEGE